MARHRNIEYWDDERSIGNSLIVTLVRGLKFAADPLACEHVRGFDTVREAMQESRNAIPCDCQQCKVTK